MAGSPYYVFWIQLPACFSDVLWNYQWALYISGVRTWLLKVKPKMAEIEGAIVRQFQSPARKYRYAIQWNCRVGDWNWRTIAPSISAIFGFTLLLGRMTEVLTPDIYGAHWELSIKYPQSIMVVVFSKGNKGNRLLCICNVKVDTLHILQSEISPKRRTETKMCKRT